MAQYRSQWTGEVIDTAVGNAKDLTFVEIGIDAAGALEKCKKAFGVSALYGIGDYDPLVYLSANLYHCISGGIFGGNEYWFARLRGTRLTLYRLYEANNVAYWDGPTITDFAEADDVNARLRGADAAFNCRYDTSSYNIEAGQYVFWKKYLWIATKNIAVGDTLASTGANKNLERVSNGGLNDLKSALDATQTTTTGNLTLASGVTASEAKYTLCGKIMALTLRGIQATGTGWTQVATIPLGHTVTNRQLSLYFDDTLNVGAVTTMRVYGSRIDIYNPLSGAAYYGGITIILD